MDVRWIILSGEVKTEKDIEDCKKNMASWLNNLENWFYISKASCIITSEEQSKTAQVILSAIKDKRTSFIRGIFYDSNYQLSEKIEKEFKDILLIVDIGTEINDVKKILSQIKGKKVVVIYLKGENK